LEGPTKNRVAALHKVTFVSKNVLNGGASLDSFFKAIWLHALKFSDYLELYNTTYRKKSATVHPPNFM